MNNFIAQYVRRRIMNEKWTLENSRQALSILSFLAPAHEAKCPIELAKHIKNYVETKKRERMKYNKEHVVICYMGASGFGSFICEVYGPWNIESLKEIEAEAADADWNYPEGSLVVCIPILNPPQIGEYGRLEIQENWELEVVDVFMPTNNED